MDADGGGDELNFLREMGLLVASILRNQLGLSAAKEASQMETGKLLPGSQRVDYSIHKIDVFRLEFTFVRLVTILSVKSR